MSSCHVCELLKKSAFFVLHVHVITYNLCRAAHSFTAAHRNPQNAFSIGPARSRPGSASIIATLEALPSRPAGTDGPRVEPPSDGASTGPPPNASSSSSRRGAYFTYSLYMCAWFVSAKQNHHMQGRRQAGSQYHSYRTRTHSRSEKKK